MFSGLLARFVERHSEVGHCSPDLWRAIPKWGIAHPICGESFRSRESLARFAESHSEVGSDSPNLQGIIPKSEHCIQAF